MLFFLEFGGYSGFSFGDFLTEHIHLMLMVLVFGCLFLEHPNSLLKFADLEGLNMAADAGRDGFCEADFAVLGVDHQMSCIKAHRLELNEQRQSNIIK